VILKHAELRMLYSLNIFECYYLCIFAKVAGIMSRHLNSEKC